MIDPAGKPPATADPVTTRGGVGDTARAQATGNNLIGIAVDFARAYLRQERCPESIGRADHQVPCSGGVRLRDGLDDLQST